MNILITGAGLIGSNAARHAVDGGHKVVLFDLSPNRDYIQKIVGMGKAEVVAADMRDFILAQSADTRRHFDVVAEQLRGEIRLTAKGHAALIAGQSRLGQRVDRLEREREAMHRTFPLHVCR